MKTIKVEVNGVIVETTRAEVTLNLNIAQEKLMVINEERNRIIKRIRRYKSDLKLFDDHLARLLTKGCLLQRRIQPDNDYR